MIGLVVVSLISQYSYCPAGNVSHPNACTLHGDPVDLSYGNYTFERLDSELVGGRSALSFRRTFSSSEKTWGAPNGRHVGIEGLPKPFGETTAGAEMYWWHNWFSFVEDNGSTAWLRSPGGRATSWTISCTSGFASPNSGSDEEVRLSCPLSTGGYVVHDGDGRVLRYTTHLSHDSINYYFLSQIEDETGRALVILTYDLPIDESGKKLEDCPRPDETTWAPYLTLIQETSTREAIALRYQRVTINNEVVCPIRVLRHGTSPLGSRTGLTPVRRYTVAYTPDYNGPTSTNWEISGRLKQVERSRADGQFYSDETYYYFGSDKCSSQCPMPPTACSCESGETGCCNSTCIEPDSPCLIFEARRGPGRDIWVKIGQPSGAVERAYVDGVQDIGYEFSSSPSVVVREQTSRPGLAAPARTDFALAPNPGTHSTRRSGAASPPITGAPVPPPPGFYEAGIGTTYDWYSLGPDRLRRTTTSDGDVSLSVMDGNIGNRVASQQLGVDNTIPWSGSLATPGNCHGLECVWTTYAATPSGVIHPSSDFERSVVSSGQLVETQRKYHSTGLPSSVIRRGFVFATTSSVAERYVGVFFRTTRTTGGSCLGGSQADKIVEVEGPCLVSDFSSTTCSGNDGRLAQFEYYAEVDSDPNSGKLKSVREYPGGCTGTVLTTTFSKYGITGKPGKVDDGNDITTLVYDDEGHVISVTKSAGTWTYGYTPHGKIAWSRSPEGQYVVSCYSTVGANQPPCDTNPVASSDVKPDPIWVARAANSDGTDWTSLRVDARVNGKIYARTFYGKDALGNSVAEFIEDYSYDGRHRLSGASGRGATPAAVKYNLDNELVFYGPAENEPPEFCWTSTGPSPKCYEMMYDRASRLSRLRQTPSIGNEVNVLLEYDAAGNACEIGIGAPSSPTPGCSLTNSDTAGYQFDDFGNLARLQLPNTGSTAKGQILNFFNAAGRLTSSQTAQQATSGAFNVYTYDRSGRITNAAVAQPGQGVTSLYSFFYDAVSVPVLCPAGLNTGRRLAAQAGPAGTTYYAYTPAGQVATEALVISGANDCSTPGSSFISRYEYTPSGHLKRIRHGDDREILYEYWGGADTDRVSTVNVKYDGVLTPIILDVRWTARGDLKKYTTIAGYPSLHAVSYERSTSGLLEKVEINGVFKKTYDWTGSGHTPLPSGRAVTTCTSYKTADELCQWSLVDDLGRLIQHENSGQSTWSWDTRGNATIVGTGAPSQQIRTYSALPRPDQLLNERSSASTDSHIRRDFLYDNDGRVSQVSWPVDSSGSFSGSFAVGYSGPSAASGDSAVKTVAVNGLVYQYVYDARQRRVAKHMPWGGSIDRFFYSPDSPRQLSFEISRNRADGRIIDDLHVWLGGHLVAVQRGARSSTWSRLSDAESDCSRGGEISDLQCGVRWLADDHIGHPVVAFDRAARITGVGEYSPFGALNTRSLYGESAHPYSGTSNTTLANWSFAQLGLRLIWRLNFDAFDTESGYDSVTWKDGNGALLQTGSGHHRGRHSWGWREVTTASQSVDFSYDGYNCDPIDCSSSTWPYSGVALRDAEYQRYELGASAWFPNIRFPGQYYDTETRYSENWNRFYDSSLGRYLSPEPLLQSPGYVKKMAKRGMSVPAYAYAANNPIRHVDATGLWTQVIISYGDLGRLDDVGTHAAVRIDNAGTGESVLFDPSGSYEDATRGSGGFFEAEEARLGPYIRHHTKQGDGVLVYYFDTTPEEEAEIARRFGFYSDEGPRDPRGLNCALTVSSNLAGVGPFRDLQPTSFPGNLSQQLCRIVGVCSPDPGFPNPRRRRWRGPGAP